MHEMGQQLNAPFIFLDFDGVLHPVDYLSFKEIDGELVLTDDARCCWAAILWTLIKDCNCQLVIHSSWRESYSLQALRDMLPVELGKRVIDTTVGKGRYLSILKYVEENDVQRYIILDDAADEFPSNCDELVLCEGGTGISRQEIQIKVKTFLERTSDYE